jgi:hypothetical protein
MAGNPHIVLSDILLRFGHPIPQQKCASPHRSRNQSSQLRQDIRTERTIMRMS